MILRTNIVLDEARVKQLLPRLLAGDDEAADELMLGYIRYIRTVWSTIGDDLYAVALMEMVRKIRHLQKTGQFEGDNLTAYIKASVGWELKRIKTKEHLIPIESRQWRGKPIQMLPMSAINRVSVSHHHKVLRHMALHDALDQLEEAERQILILRSESFTIEEIAEKTGISKSSVHRIATSATEKMRHMLEN